MKIAHISEQKTAINENQKVGSFYDRVVEYGPGIGCCAAGAAVVYWLNAPIVGAIGISIGSILICKRLFARSAAVANPLLNPLMKNLEEIKSSDGKEAVKESLESFVKVYDNTSAQNQVAIIKEMTSMLYDDVTEDAMKVLLAIRKLIDEKKLNEIDNFEAFVNGIVAFFEKIASKDAEKDKSDVLSGTIGQLHRFLVEKKALDIGNKKQQINLSQLYTSLDNLTLSSKHGISLINQIKQTLPQSSSEEVVWRLKNMESPNPKTRSAALLAVYAAYDVVPDSQVDIIKAIIKMLKDNVGDIGKVALANIELLVVEKKLNNTMKLQAFIDGIADHFKNPGELEWGTAFPNDARIVLNKLIETILRQFQVEYEDAIKGGMIDFTRLKDSLEQLNKCIPDSSVFPTKGGIQRIRESYKLINIDLG